MGRRIFAMTLAVAVLLVFSVGPALADRLGGAYRGPYEEDVRVKDVESTEVTQDGATADRPPDAAGGGQDSGGAGSDGSYGATDPGGGTEDPPPGDDDDSGGAAEPPTAGVDGGGGDTSSGHGAPSASPPGGGTAGAGGIGGTAGVGPGGGGKVAVEDVQAYWPFFFEHNKEWILDDVLRARMARSRVAKETAAYYYMQTGGAVRKPVTPEQIENVILPVLLEAAESKSSWVRDAAIFALGKLGSEAVIAPLAMRVNDVDPDLREDALLALGLTGQKDALRILMSNLGDGDLRPYAALGLGLLGQTEPLPALLREYKALVSNPAPWAEEHAACLAAAIGMLGDESVIDDLAQPLRNPKGRDYLKVHICQALGRIGGENAAKWLLRALSDRDRDVQASVMLALSNFTDKGVFRQLTSKAGIKSGNRMTKLFAAIALGRIGRELPPDDTTRKQISMILKELTEEVRKDKYTSTYAALGQGIMGDGSSKDFFREFLEPGQTSKFSKENHAIMAMVMGMLEDRETMFDLRELVRKGDIPELRGYAAFALGIMGDNGSREIIREGLQDRRAKPEYMRSACWALGLLGNPQDVDLLISCLKLEGQSKHTVRGAAAVALGLMRDGTSVDKLVRIAQRDKDNSSRAFAIVALGCMVDRSMVPRVPQIFMNTNYRKKLTVVRDVLTNL